MASKKSSEADRITLEALQYYVPIYQLGDKAEAKLLEECSTLSPGERNHLETLIKLKELSLKKITNLSGPLITKELNKIISTSHLRNQEGLFDILYYAGLNGMRLGLRKFDVEKMNVSSTNYLFQWITTYAKKELNILEAPFGIPPSRFQKYKKISAVRKKLSEANGREVSNEEIFNYFQSGSADVSSMNGRISNRGHASKANQLITLALIQEQEKFEKEMFSVELLDPLDGFTVDVQLSSVESPIFQETVFGVFSDVYHVSAKARVVIMSELNIDSVSEEDIELLKSLSKKEYKNYAVQWQNLIKDVKGPFYQFLKDNIDEEFTQFDVKSVMKSIESERKSIDSAAYDILFDNERVKKK